MKNFLIKKTYIDIDIDIITKNKMFAEGRKKGEEKKKEGVLITFFMGGHFLFRFFYFGR